MDDKLDTSKTFKVVPTYDKIQNAAHRLNADAYRLQMKGRDKPLKHFDPCPRSLVLLDCLREAGHLGTAMANASLTCCDCHPGLDLDGLYKMSLDDSARRKHESGER
jgi:hypothetical protein